MCGTWLRVMPIRVLRNRQRMANTMAPLITRHAPMLTGPSASPAFFIRMKLAPQMVQIMRNRT